MLHCIDRTYLPLRAHCACRKPRSKNPIPARYHLSSLRLTVVAHSPNLRRDEPAPFCARSLYRNSTTLEIDLLPTLHHCRTACAPWRHLTAQIYRCIIAKLHLTTQPNATLADFHPGQKLFAYITINCPQLLRDLGNCFPLRIPRLAAPRHLLQDQALIKPFECTGSKLQHESSGSGHGTC